MKSLRGTDLNLVPVLQALLREKSVSRAAGTLALSQPAVSASLRRLRLVFDDQLLVRVGGGMTLTPRALALAAQVELACDMLDGLFAIPVFDPALAKRSVVIAAPDQASFLLAPAWLRMLERDAPGVRLRFVDLGEGTALQLAGREVDFAIMPSFFVEDLPPAPLHFQPLFRDASVALFRNDHPLAAHDRVTQAHLAAHRMVGFHPGFDRIERKRGAALMGQQHFNIIADVPQTTLSPFLLLDSDYFGIVSRRMAQRLAQVLPLAWRDFAFPTPPIDIGLAWSQVQDGDPAHRWFRETVAIAGV